MKLFSLLLALNVEDYMLPCFTKKIFGFDCLGCGLQRSVAFLFRGDFLAAWEMYPAIFTIIPLFGMLAVDQLVEIKYANKILITLMIASVVLILTNYILKFI
ncbi:MAG: DUF2752 domain-containing protein [Maribacter sp.]|uniref:DUF2752 domain-containing protein n=1 Tax=Maribacter sp. TaxID=1897614 RepID=UPI003296A094